MKRLFAFDVDDTLIPRGETSIPPKEIEAINHRLALGDAVALASGRPFASLARYLASFIPGEKYVIAFNGAIVYSLAGEVLYSETLSYADLYYVYSLYPDPKFDVYAYLRDGSIAAFKKGKYVQLEEEINRLPPSLILPPSPIGVDLTTPVAKVMIGADPDVSKTIVFHDSRYDVTRSSPVFFEILHPGVDKAKGVGFVKEYAKAQEAYCFGDELNDFGMVKAFHGVAMGNGVDQVKQAAEIVTKPCAEDGVSYALEHLLRL